MSPATRSRPQLGDEAASYIRDQITSGTLSPGAHVRPEVIASELGISSTPAREALQTLRAEGFLDLSPRRGFTVANLSGDDIRDMFLVQSMVAGELAARAAPATTPELLARLEEIHGQLGAAADRGDLEALEEWNHQFHREVNLAADAPKLSWVLRTVSRYAPRRFYATIEGWSQTTLDDHRGLLEAMRSGDAERARAAMSEHVKRAGEQLAHHVDARLVDAPDGAKAVAAAP
jgi:DNA-binding GntR family transcriptional regulator